MTLQEEIAARIVSASSADGQRLAPGSAKEAEAVALLDDVARRLGVLIHIDGLPYGKRGARPGENEPSESIPEGRA